MSKSKDKKLKVKTWQISFYLAIIVLVFFLLIHCEAFGNRLSAEIPNPYYRTLTAGLLLSVIVFISCGLFHHYYCPVKESVKKEKISMSPLGIIGR
jgi:hypothetical protein